jgi:hypothetical protein
VNVEKNYKNKEDTYLPHRTQEIVLRFFVLSHPHCYRSYWSGYEKTVARSRKDKNWKEKYHEIHHTSAESGPVWKCKDRQICNELLSGLCVGCNLVLVVDIDLDWMFNVAVVQILIVLLLIW